MSVEKRGMKKGDLLRLESYQRTIEPPAGLQPEIADVFREIVASCDVTHFRKSDIPMMTSFATVTCLSRHYADRLKEPGVFKIWQDAIKLQVSLARSLRLTEPTRKQLQDTMRRTSRPHGSNRHNQFR